MIDVNKYRTISAEQPVVVAVVGSAFTVQPNDSLVYQTTNTIKHAQKHKELNCLQDLSICFIRPYSRRSHPWICLSVRDVRPHCFFFVQVNPLFLDQNVSFSGHFVANPSKKIHKKKKSAFGQNAKTKHQSVQMLAELPIGIL